MIRSLVAVFLGAGTGGVLRYLVNVAVAHYFQGRFPLATFLVNVSGCFLIGLVMPLVQHRDPLRLLFVAGVLGGYTTFSTFGFEIYRAIREGWFGTAFLYAAGSVIAGLAAVWLGTLVTRR
ncbi:MAG: fluoride efflux transporter CrcB [Acidobacteria bacterium]|nr:fluoride efflux transporter CrcB [Acidobacteriota bacterium]